jgi:hypothetical protein
VKAGEWRVNEQGQGRAVEAALPWAKVVEAACQWARVCMPHGYAHAVIDESVSFYSHRFIRTAINSINAIRGRLILNAAPPYKS